MIKQTLLFFGVIVLFSASSCNKSEKVEKRPDSVAVMDTVTAPELKTVAQPADNNLLAAVRDSNGKWGFINNAGEYVIPSIYDYTGKFSEGLVEVVFTDAKGVPSFYYIDGTGKTVLSNPEWKIGSPFDHGHAMVGLKSGEKDAYRYQFIDRKGNYVKNLPEFPQIFYWRARVFPVKDETSGKYAYIDTLGNVRIPAKFDFARDAFYQDITSVSKEVAPKKFLKGFIDLKGNWVVEPTLDVTRQFIEGKAIIHDEPTNTWGYLDSTGKKHMVTEPGVELAFIFTEGKVGAKKNGKWGFMDENFNWVIPPTYVSIAETKGPGRFSEGFRVFDMGTKENPRMGMVDAKGNIFLNPFFRDLGQFSSGLAYAMHPKQGNGKYGYLDKNGNWAIPPRFTDASYFVKVKP